VIRPIEHNTEEQHGPADHRDRAEHFLNPQQFERQPDDQHRKCCEDQQGGQPCAGGVHLAAQQATKPDCCFCDLRPEVEHDRKKRAHMHRDINRKPLIRPAGQRWQQDQMTRGRDRQKLCQTLNDCDKQQLEHGHKGGGLWVIGDGIGI